MTIFRILRRQHLIEKKLKIGKHQKISHFRPSRQVETLRDEISCLKGGLNISRVISRPQLWPFFEFGDAST